MDYDGRGRVVEGFGPVPRFATDQPFGDQKGRFVADDRDSSRALTFLGELGLKVTKESVVLVPALVSLLKHDAAVVVRQCIVSGTGFFCAVLEEIALQIHNSGMIERWLEEIWSWMLKFRDALFGIIVEHGSVGVRALAVKFLEIYVLLFSSDPGENERTFTEGYVRRFNISRLVGRNPILDSGFVSFDTKRCLDFLLSLLNYSGTFPASLTIIVINCLANIARKRPVHYNRIFSALMAFDSDFDYMKEGHAGTGSIRYSLRTAFLGFLRCAHHPSIADSRDKLLWALRAMNPGESTEQIIRQAEKISKNMERISRDSKISKDEMALKQIPTVGDLPMKKILPENDNSMITDDAPSKRVRYEVSANSASHFVNVSPLENGEEDPVDDSSSKDSLLDSMLPAVEQMIAMIGVMIAQGEKGASHLELLISKMQPELLADIVIVNMKHLPSSLPPLVSRLWNTLDPSQSNLGMNTTSMVGTITADTSAFHSSEVPSQQLSTSVSSSGVSAVTPDTPSVPNMVDSKRDPRRDPRRLDPRRLVAPVGSDSTPSNADSINSVHSSFDNTQSKPVSDTVVAKVDILSVSPKEEHHVEPPEAPVVSLTIQLTSPEVSKILSEGSEVVPSSEVPVASEPSVSPVPIELDFQEPTPSAMIMKEEVDADMMDADQQQPFVSGTLAAELTHDLPPVPTYIHLSDEQTGMLGGFAIFRVIEVYKHMPTTDCFHVCLSLLPRLVAQRHDSDEIIAFLQKHIILDYQRHKGHELVMHILYHIHAIIISDEQESSFAFIIYEKFLLAVAKSLRESLPASDKSFSRLLSEVPLLPDSALKLLEDLCQTPSSDQLGKDACDGDRVTQGLGTVWNLILVRPMVRLACLSIALKCTVHAQDEVRAKAIRLVANKLYLLSYVSETIEQFAKDKLLSLVDKGAQDADLISQNSGEQRIDASSQDTSTSGIQNSVVAAEFGSVKDAHTTKVCNSVHISLSQAQRYASLFFALCTKKASLLQVVFDIYGKAPKAVKQSIHRHVPALVRNMGSSFSDLLKIISDPSEGSENLLMLVLQILTEEMTPSMDLIATVKHLYATKLKDAAILIPLLSSLSKNEVLPIFPRLVDLPLEKFQTALARILEGSAHTGPALTPVEVLVAIHDINPERDGVPLKKIMDACTACFEQRTVFTQQVLAKSLNQLVDRTHLPLLFMRTVIQAIDAFPTLVDFVMEILSKLVSKQIWKMPKLWVGFLKCASQTQPHSFPVLLLLPAQQLEIVLSRHPNLRAPLSAHASQPHIKNSLSRPILASLGLVSEPQQQSPPVVMSSMRTSDTSGSSIHGAALT